MKTLLPIAAATNLLNSEFARQKSIDCHDCSVPGLFWGPAPEGITGLWYLKALPSCPQGCHKVVAQIWVDITSAHTIEYSPPARIATKRRPTAASAAARRKWVRI